MLRVGAATVVVVVLVDVVLVDVVVVGAAVVVVGATVVVVGATVVVVVGGFVVVVVGGLVVVVVGGFVVVVGLGRVVVVGFGRVVVVGRVAASAGEPFGSRTARPQAVIAATSITARKRNRGRSVRRSFVLIPAISHHRSSQANRISAATAVHARQGFSGLEYECRFTRKQDNSATLPTPDSGS